MIRALLRLLVISILCVIVIFFALFSVRQLGTMQGFSPTPHSWMAKDFWWIWAPPLEVLCDGRTQVNEAFQSGRANQSLANDELLIVRLPIDYKEGRWFIPCPSQSLDLGEYLKGQNQVEWMIQTVAPTTDPLSALLAVLEPLDKQKQFAVQASSQQVSRFLRKKAPQWLYIADPTSLLRLQVFTRLWIETATDFWPDFVLTSIDKKNPESLSDRALREVARRKKRVLLDLSANSELSSTEPLAFPVHGVLTSRPTRRDQLKLLK